MHLTAEQATRNMNCRYSAIIEDNHIRLMGTL
jgi:hypothetical protein